MAHVVVIGYGDPRRRDGGLGAEVSAILKDEFAGADVLALACQRLTPDLAGLLGDSRTVLFVDASAEKAAGEFNCIRLEGAAESEPPATYISTPASLLALSCSLHGEAPEGYLLTIGGASFDDGRGLSSTVRASLPALLEQARGLVRAALSEGAR